MIGRLACAIYTAVQSGPEDNIGGFLDPIAALGCL
jgi:hypothetical protein